VAVLLVAAALIASCGARDVGPPPNVLLIVADDLGWGDVGYHGGSIPTPHIDGLAREGVALERFYAQPLCTATRAGLMTGRSAIRFGMQYHPITPGDRIGLAASEFGLAQAFARAGYATALLGKWHLGYAERELLPNAHGFEHFYGHLMSGLDYFGHHFPAGGHDWQRNGVSVHESGYSTFLLGDEAVAWIRDHARAPFFLMLSFNAPHVPLQAPASLGREFTDRASAAERRYTAVVVAMDRTIGRVLETLRAEQIEERTIVLFLSDNGGFDRYARNAPLRGGKRSTGEGGLRVVATLRWPGGLSTGRSEQFLSHLDVLPTLASAAGIDLPASVVEELDGRDMWDVIRGGAVVAREPFFFGVDSPMANGDVHVAVIEAGQKLVQVRAADGSRREWLYDLVSDPYERRSLAGERPRRVAELSARIDAWQALHPAEGIRNLTPPSPLVLPDDFNILAPSARRDQ